MGTRGYRVTRFRGRYYRFYNHWDSYPEGLGKNIAKDIPADPAAYQEWLAQRRQEALEWHNALERFLCRKSAEDLDEPAKDVEELEFEEETSVEQSQPWGVATDVLPDFTPAFNDLYIEWVYTIDLDNEVFTIDNGAHVQLIRASDLAWIKALAHGFYGDKILLPGGISKEATADIVIKLSEPSPSILDASKKIDIKIVQAKGLHGFPPSHRHGPLFRSRIFYFFREIYEPILAAALLSWRAEDLVFRDIAYAVLSLASANLYPSIVSDPQVLRNGRIAYAALKKGGEMSEKDEFISHLGVGSHLKDVLPGSSPDSGMYWFENVLVHLVVQLIDWADIFTAAGLSVGQYCQRERPNQRVDAILMSVEHVVLMKIHSDGRVERTSPLPLFDIHMHTTMNADVRYNASELEELQTHKIKALKRRETRERRRRKSILIARGKPIEDELKDISLESDESEDEGCANVEEQTSWPAAGLRPPRVGKSEESFTALTLFLEASSRRHLPSSTTEGVFPTELYRAILLNVEDVETHRACMQVSRNFRDMCQQDILMLNKIRFQANEASRTYEPATSSSSLALRMRNMSESRSHDVVVTRVGDLSGLGFLGAIRNSKALDEYYRCIIGSEYNRRSLVPDLIVTFDEVD